MLRLSTILPTLHIVMLKHGPFMATEKSVLAHETRPDKLAKSAGTGYQQTCATARSNRSPATGRCPCTRPIPSSTSRRLACSLFLW